jgi:hypothetical protein
MGKLGKVTWDLFALFSQVLVNLQPLQDRKLKNTSHENSGWTER